MNAFSLPNLHPAGWPFIAAFAVAAAILGWLAAPLGWLGAAATLWCVYFFRDPERVPPEGALLIVSPADGTVEAIAQAVPPRELEMGERPRTRVSVFLSVFDVHVNRVPAEGTIVRVVRRPGKFFDASFDKASEFNERVAVLMRLPSGHDLAFAQIAGLVARRIVCDLRPEQKVLAGERFGIIRFGSRLDVYVPEDFRVRVRKGQRMVGGETVIAEPAGAKG